jgi:hypothetical protein
VDLNLLSVLFLGFYSSLAYPPSGRYTGDPFEMCPLRRCLPRKKDVNQSTRQIDRRKLFSSQKRKKNFRFPPHQILDFCLSLDHFLPNPWISITRQDSSGYCFSLSGPPHAIPSHAPKPVNPVKGSKAVVG